jgi:hypothetical protein
VLFRSKTVAEVSTSVLRLVALMMPMGMPINIESKSAVTDSKNVGLMDPGRRSGIATS